MAVPAQHPFARTHLLGHTGAKRPTETTLGAIRGKAVVPATTVVVVRVAAATRGRGAIATIALRNLQFEAILSLHKILVPGQHPKEDCLHVS